MIRGKSKDKVYTYDVDDGVVQFNLVLGGIYSLKIIEKYGFTIEANFTFEPIPFNNTEISKTNYKEKPYVKTRYKNKWIFTQFNPGFNIKTGIYYDLPPNWRLTIGGGFGWHDAYKPYRRVTLDNQRISEQIEKNKLCFTTFAKAGYFF